MRIEANTFLISGGASGLGRASTQVLHAAGANVVVADLNDAAGATVQKELGARCRFVRADATSEEAVKAAVAAALQAFGALHGVVNTAGIGTAAKVLGKSGPHALELFARTVHINLVGTFNVIRLAADAMSKNAPEPTGVRGVIVNTASVAAFEGQIGQAAYSASKGGVASMTLPIARELAALGIRVLTIAPGIFDTPLLAGLPEPARVSLGEQVPFPQRLGRPGEYAALVKHVIENEYLNGEVIRLDGALRMAPR